MKTAGQQRKTTTGLSAKSKAGASLNCTKSGTSIVKVANQRQKRKEHSGQMKTSNRNVNLDELPRESFISLGKNNIELNGRPSSSPVQPSSLQAQIIGTSLQKAAPGIPMLVPEQPIERFQKFKLQLFPIDEATHKKLEKDKHNPYLELTLGTQKKISSVVKHLNTKWGNSIAASGEIMLFPFNARLENLASYRRWTSKDSDTSTADVYVAVGNPAVFRLRYGWFSSLEPKVCAMPLTSLHCNNNLQAKENQKKNICGEKKHPRAASNPEHETMSINGSLNQGPATTIMLDTSVQASNKENIRNCNGASLLWLDSISNISFGALLSEISPTPDTSRGNPLPLQNNTSFQPISNFDSFDAAVAGYIARHQSTNISTQVPNTSIWDAEETCHAFPSQKISSSGNGIPALSNGAPFMSCSRAISSSSMRLHNTAKPGSHLVGTQDDACQEPASSQQIQIKGDACPEPTADLHPNTKDGANEESKAELQCQAAASHNDGNHVGRMDFYWPESLGPLEYVASSSRQIIGGDSIGLSGLISSSLDAFQNFSIF